MKVSDWVPTLSLSATEAEALLLICRDQGWSSVAQIVRAVSTGAVRYVSFVESLSVIKNRSARERVLASMRLQGLPDDHLLSIMSEISESGGNALDTLWKLADTSLNRLWFVENWGRETHQSFFSLFLADWLTLPDVVRFDTAVTNRKLRPLWQQHILKSLQSVGLDKHEHTPQSLDWIRRRCCRIRRLVTKESARATIVDSCFAPLAATEETTTPPPSSSSSSSSSTLFPELTHLELGAENATHCNVSVAGIERLVKGCPRLTHISLMHCDANDAGVRHLAKHCPRLSSLSVKYCSKISDGCIATLLQGCPRLEHLDLSWCNKLTDAALKTIGEKLPGLLSLDLSLCTQLTDAGVKHIAKGAQRLQSLSLYACKLVTDACLKAIAAGCPRLECLKLSLCEKVTNEGVQAVASHCPSLTYINLSLCEKVTDDGVVALAENCPLLECVNVYGDKLVTNTSLLALAEHCPDLTSLNLYRCELVTDEGLVALVGLHKLRIINLWNCRQVTGAAVSRLALELRGLKSLDARNCEGVTSELLDELKAKRPELDLDGNINSDKYDKIDNPGR